MGGRYRHPPGLGPQAQQAPGVPPGYMLVDVPDQNLGALGQGRQAAGGLAVFLLGLGLGYFLGRKGRIKWAR